MGSDYLVMSQYGTKEIVRETTQRKAIIKLLKEGYGLKNPKLFKIYFTDLEGRDYHNGYGCGNRWFKAWKMESLENEVK